MRANTNITRKERSSLTLSNLRGADFSSSPLDAASNRAVEMRNLYCDGGQLRKRHGWKEKLKFDGRINGIFDYRNGEYSATIVHAGTKIYRVKDGYSEDITGSFYITDSKSQGFSSQDKLYIIGCGDYLEYGVFNTVYEDNNFTYEEKVAMLGKVSGYIPTTTVSINVDGEADKRETLDEPNLLRNERINKLLGVANNTGASIYWTLDSKIDYENDNPKFVHVTICTKDDDDNLVTLYASNLYNNKPSNSLILKDYEMADPTKKLNITKKLSGQTHTDKVEKESAIGDIVYPNKIGFDINVLPQVEGLDNISVTFYHTPDNYEKTQNYIKKSTIGTLFGTNGNNDRLFVSGNADCPNMVFWSADNNFTYFPDRNYAKLGSETVAINGFGRLSDSTLAIYKEKDDKEATIYYSSGIYENFTLNNIVVAKEIYSFKSGSTGEGAVTPYACAQLAGDNLMLSSNGVFGIVLTDNVATNERYARERSRLINKRLCQHDLSKAVGIAYKNRYYLAVDGVCYVADARYKTSVDDDIDGSYNYEWWYWDNIPARVWAVMGGKLYFGTDDGRICVFDDEYTDRTYSCTDKGELSIDSDNHCITYDGKLEVDGKPFPISNGDIVTLNDYLNDYIYAIKLRSATVFDGKIEVFEDIITDFRNGDELFADNVGNSGLYVNSVYTVGDVDYGTCTFALYDSSGEAVMLRGGGFNLYRRFTNYQFYVTNVENNTFQLSAVPNPDERDILKLSTYNEGIATNIYATFEHRRPVVAEWYSPMLDFGTPVSSKTLLGLTAVSEPIQGGKLSFGYETRNANKIREMKGINTFSLDNLDFNNFSLDTGFATSYSVKVFEKFNFIQFRFVSDNDKDCALNSLTALYKINKSNRGVR